MANSIMGRRSHHLPSSGSLAHLAEPVSTEPGTPAQDGWERRLGGPAEGFPGPPAPGHRPLLGGVGGGMGRPWSQSSAVGGEWEPQQPQGRGGCM